MAGTARTAAPPGRVPAGEGFGEERAGRSAGGESRSIRWVRWAGSSSSFANRGGPTTAEPRTRVPASPAIPTRQPTTNRGYSLSPGSQPDGDPELRGNLPDRPGPDHPACRAGGSAATPHARPHPRAAHAIGSVRRHWCAPRSDRASRPGAIGSLRHLAGLCRSSRAPASSNPGPRATGTRVLRGPHRTGSCCRRFDPTSPGGCGAACCPVCSAHRRMLLGAIHRLIMHQAMSREKAGYRQAAAGHFPTRPALGRQRPTRPRSAVAATRMRRVSGENPPSCTK